MALVLIKREGDPGAHVLGSIPREDGHIDVCLELRAADEVEGVAASDWPEGVHDLPDDPEIVEAE